MNETERLLCLSMIVKNEADSIEKVIESCNGAIDYAIIVDTGSTDDTVSIAESTLARLGIPGRIVREPFVDFATTRNFALSLSEKEARFSLIMSGDEYLENPAMLRAYLSNIQDEFDLFTMSTRLLYSNTINSIARIFRSGSGAHYQGKIHEEPVGYKQAAHIPLTIFHDDSFMRDEAKRTARLQRDVRMMKEALSTQGRTTYMLRQLMSALVGLKEYQQCLDVAEEYKDIQHEDLTYFVMKSKMELGLPYDKELDQSVRSPRNSKRALYLHAMKLREKSEFVQAMNYAVACACAPDEDPNGPGIIVDVGLSTWKPHWLICSIATSIGDKQLALNAAAEAIEQSSGDPKIVKMLEKLVDMKEVAAILTQNRPQQGA